VLSSKGGNNPSMQLCNDNDTNQVWNILPIKGKPGYARIQSEGMLKTDADGKGYHMMKKISLVNFKLKIYETAFIGLSYCYST